jgi:two-component system KDP operon response regulator KdpE
MLATAVARRIELDRLVIDRDAFEVRIGGQRIRLTYIEFGLLCTLAVQAGKVVSHETLIEAVWGTTDNGRLRRLRVHISRLRQKLVGIDPWRIITVTKRGYALVRAQRQVDDAR